MNHVIMVNFVRGLLSMTVLVGAAGCTTEIRIPREQAAQIGPASGLVFGSIRISVGSSLPDTSPSLAPGRKTVGAAHKLTIDCSTLMQTLSNVPNKATLPLSIGEELVLVQKLPARRCHLVHEVEGGFLLPMASRIGIVDVQGGRTIYFGAVELRLPTLIAVGGQTRSTVADQKARTVQAWRMEYGTLLDDAPFQPVVLPR
jgi:hypothetical protein